MVHHELDSFYVKFKNLLLTEKDATLTLKSEAGRALITLSVDLGHVLSAEDQLPPSRHRNGPARQHRREKRAAARNEKQSADKVEVNENDVTEKVAEEPTVEHSTAEEAIGDGIAEKVNEMKTADKVEVTENDVTEKVAEEPTVDNSTAEEAMGNGIAEKVNTMKDAAKVENMRDLDDEVCPDEIYRMQPERLVSAESQALEFGIAPRTRRIGGVDYYSLCYDDPDPEDDSFSPR